MLQIVAPVSMVLGSLNAGKDPIAVLSTVNPIAFIDASICIDHAPTPIGLVVLPEALKSALVVPHYGASSTPFARRGLTLAVISLTFP